LKTIWITGAGGLIGNFLVQSAPPCRSGHLDQVAAGILSAVEGGILSPGSAPEFACVTPVPTTVPPGRMPGSTAGKMPAATPRAKVIGLTRAMLNLADFPAVRAEFSRQQPQLVIHCAALSQSTACQTNPALARTLNVEVTSLLAELAAEIPFVFLSTDLVFDGQTGNYDESARVNPLSIYAETKAAAERIVLANPRHIVLRLSLNGGTSPSGNRGFNEQMRRAWQAGQSLKLFTDEFRSPLSAAVTARAIWELTARNEPGLYHLAGGERLSRWQIGQLLAARWPQLHPRIEAASLSQYAGAPRAPDTSLNCAKVQKLLSFRLPGLTEWLAAHPDEAF
jgi:dTDP-4-dehydrorhamnose reductase